MKTITTSAFSGVVIETLDGRSYVGATLREAVQRIRASAWACTDSSLRGYMESVARRAGEWTKHAIVRTDSIDNFVADMESCGLFRVHRIS
jgi:muconolactone delta-isomerase